MVYESDFYTTRRPYRSTPSYSTYTVSSPRHYVVRDSPDRNRRAAEEVYSYSYSSNVESHRSSDPYSRPTSRSYSTAETVNRSSSSGPGSYSYSTERSSRSRGDGPGGYHSSYSSTTSGRLPGGTSYRHYSYRSAPSRSVRVLPGLGKVYVIHTYNRIVPYVGHKKLTVVTSPPKIFATRPSILQHEYDWIENRIRPWVAYSPTNHYLNSHAFTDFDDERRLIRAQTSLLLKQIHLPLPRIRFWPIAPLNRYGENYSLPARYSNDTYIHRLLTISPNSNIEYTTYYTKPIKKYIGKGHLSCASYAGDKCYSRRRPLKIYEDAVKNDIQLLSYYINKFRQEKAYPKEIEAALPPARPSRRFNLHKPMEDPIVDELKNLREERAERLRRIYESDDKTERETKTAKKPAFSPIVESPEPIKRVVPKEEPIKQVIPKEEPIETPSVKEEIIIKPETVPEPVQSEKPAKKTKAKKSRLQEEKKEPEVVEPPKPEPVIEKQPEEVPQLPEEVAPPPEEVPQLPEEVPQLPEEVLQPPEEVPQLPEEVLQPPEEVPQLPEETAPEAEPSPAQPEIEQLVLDAQETEPEVIEVKSPEPLPEEINAAVEAEETPVQEEVAEAAPETNAVVEEPVPEEPAVEEQPEGRAPEQIDIEEERQQILRLEAIAKEAEEEKERDLARQAEELAEIARKDVESIETLEAELNGNEVEVANEEQNVQEVTEEAPEDVPVAENGIEPETNGDVFEDTLPDAQTEEEVIPIAEKSLAPEESTEKLELLDENTSFWNEE